MELRDVNKIQTLEDRPLTSSLTIMIDRRTSETRFITVDPGRWSHKLWNLYMYDVKTKTLFGVRKIIFTLKLPRKCYRAEFVSSEYNRRNKLEL